MQKKLDLNDVKFAEDFLRETNPGFMYNYLSVNGYKYATLALGVTEQNTVAGVVALNFMNAAATAQGRLVNDKKTKEILHAMASEYIKALKAQIKEGSSAVTREIDYKEAWEIHNEVFKNAGYSEDAWTLNAVFSVMPEADRELYWNQVLASAGDATAELELAANTYVLMQIMAAEGTDKEQQMAAGWLNSIESIENAKTIIELAATKIGQNLDPVLERMTNFIFDRQAAQSYYPASPSPTGVLPPPMPVPRPPKRRRRPGGGGRPPTTAGGYNNGGHYTGGGGRLIIDP